MQKEFIGTQNIQYKRFEVLTSFINEEIKHSTIVDAGCGFGNIITIYLIII